MTKTKRKIPKWMYPYLDKFIGGLERAEEFQNCDGRNCNIVVNAPRALMCQATNAKLQLLEGLKSAGLLKEVQP